MPWFPVTPKGFSIPRGFGLGWASCDSFFFFLCVFLFISLCIHLCVHQCSSRLWAEKVADPTCIPP